MAKNEHEMKIEGLKDRKQNKRESRRKNEGSVGKEEKRVNS